MQAQLQLEGALKHAQELEAQVADGRDTRALLESHVSSHAAEIDQLHTRLADARVLSDSSQVGDHCLQCAPDFFLRISEHMFPLLSVCSHSGV